MACPNPQSSLMTELEYLSTCSSEQSKLKFRTTLAKMYLPCGFLSPEGVKGMPSNSLFFFFPLATSQISSCLHVLTEYLISALLAYSVINLSFLLNNIIMAKPQWTNKIIRGFASGWTWSSSYFSQTISQHKAWVGPRAEELPEALKQTVKGNWVPEIASV